MTRQQAEALLKGKHHPHEEVHEHQLNMLMSLNPDAIDNMAFTFRVGNVNHLYYYEHKDIKPDAIDVEEWRSGLHPSIQDNEEVLNAIQSLGAKRYALERRDIGLNEYMKANLSNDDYLRWWDIGEGGRQRREVSADPL